MADKDTTTVTQGGAVAGTDRFLGRNAAGNSRWWTTTQIGTFLDSLTQTFSNKTIAGGTAAAETNAISVKNDVAADWTTNNPTLANGEIGWESDTARIKIGDGATAWTSLAYVDLHNRPVDTEAGTTDTFELADLYKYKYYTDATPDVTVPPNSSVAFPVGTVLVGGGDADAVITFIEGSGVTILSEGLVKVLTTAGDFRLTKVAANTWKLTGDLASGATIDSLTEETNPNQAIYLELSNDKKYDIRKLVPASVPVKFDGAGSVIADGAYVDVYFPFDFIITGVVIGADVSGSIVVDIWVDTHANFPPTNADSITASATPTLSTAQTDKDTTLTGWTTTISSGSWARFNVEGASTTLTEVTIVLFGYRTTAVEGA